MQRLNNQRGQALVEFALILPILLAVLIGIFDFGAAFNQKNNLTFLANQAARYASVNACAPCTGNSGTAIADYVKSTADTAHLRNSASITFCLPNGTANAGDPLEVTVKAPFSWLGAIAGSGLPTGSINITTKVTTRILQAPPDANGHTLYTAAQC